MKRKILLSTLLLALFVCCSNTGQKGVVNDRKQSSPIPSLEPSISMTVFKLIAKKNEDSSNGTGFIINKENNYYLVTAKHVFYPLSLQADYTMPTFNDSYIEVSILSPTDFSEIQREPLIINETKSLLYKLFKINENKALDIAVLKINNPSNELKKYSMPFSILEVNMDFKYDESLLTGGYPTRTKTFHSIKCSFAPKELQEMLDKDSDYYFIISTEEDLKGISGGPIFGLHNGSINKIIGVFVGQNRIHKTLGYGIYSIYITKIIDSF